MESKPKKSGGYRAGSGRKPGPTLWVRFKVDRNVWAIIEADAQQNKRTPEEHAAEILRRYASAPLFS